MPFHSDANVDTWKIELNVGEIAHELEVMLDKRYDGAQHEHSKMWLYVVNVETALTNAGVALRTGSAQDFWEWFLDNYTKIETWKEIHELFVVDEEPYCYDTDDKCVCSVGGCVQPIEDITTE
tara:strand:+ start:431 stop:799 length:369 start_codon:yes stop_codon:yes gene_type:complete